MTTSIGIYSGAFDPIHDGHLNFAQTALRECHLDKIILLPEPTPREKHSVTDISQRVEQIQLAIKNLPNLSVTKLTSLQFNISSTLPELHALFQDAHFTLLVGSDVVRTFTHRWEDLGILLDDVSFAIGMRDGDTAEEIISIINVLKEKYHTNIDYTLIYTDHGHIASSHIRNQKTN